MRFFLYVYDRWKHTYNQIFNNIINYSNDNSYYNSYRVGDCECKRVLSGDALHHKEYDKKTT